MTNRDRDDFYDDEEHDEGLRASRSGSSPNRPQRAPYGYGRESGSDGRPEGSGRWTSGSRSQRPWARSEESGMEYEPESNAPRGGYTSPGRGQPGYAREGYRGQQPYGQRGNSGEPRDEGFDPGPQGGYGQGSYGRPGYGQPEFGQPGSGRGYYGPQGWNPGEFAGERSSYGPSRGGYGEYGGPYQGWQGGQAGERGESGRYGSESRTRRPTSWSGDWSGPSRRPGNRGKGPKGYRRSDERIKEEVNECLTQDREIDASEIEVEVSNGVVILKGTIDSRETKWRLESLCDDISGVKDVQNQVRVQRDEERSQRAGDGSRTSSSNSESGFSSSTQKSSSPTSSDRGGSSKHVGAGS